MDNSTFNVAVNIDYGIQLKCLSPPAFKLHNFQLMQRSLTKNNAAVKEELILLLKANRPISGPENGTFQGMTDPGMLSNFPIIPTFPVLPLACHFRLRIREIKNTTASYTLLTSLSSNIPYVDDQEKIAFVHFISPLAHRSENH